MIPSAARLLPLGVLGVLCGAFLPGVVSAAGDPRPTDPYSISTDHATYGTRVAQQIPSITRIGQRFFCAWYGIEKGPPGTSGEGAGCYNIIAYSDDTCRTWKEFAYFIPNTAVERQSIIDPRLATTPDGKLLILIPVTAQKGRTRSIWAVQVTNPLAPDGTFTFATPHFVDYGFVGSVATIGGSQYLTANQQSSRLLRITGYANHQIQTAFVGELPPAAADGSENSFWETSLAEIGDNRILACFRGKSGQFFTRSTDAGKTWSPPARYTAHLNAPNTKAEIARTPSGNLVMAFNLTKGGRYNMTLSLSTDGGATWPKTVTFDERRDPGTSYPSITFGADAAGTYDGKIYVAYDHGRGRDEPDYTKEITVAVLAEADLLAGTPKFQRFIVSK